MKKFTPKRILSVCCWPLLWLLAAWNGSCRRRHHAPSGRGAGLGENQPTYHGHRAYDVLNWTPETDEYAQFMQANVPLQERNEAFSARRPIPRLDQKVKSLALTEDYGNEFFNPTQYNDDFAQYAFNFWQYLDYRAAWHGIDFDPLIPISTPKQAGGSRIIEDSAMVNIPQPCLYQCRP